MNLIAKDPIDVTIRFIRDYSVTLLKGQDPRTGCTVEQDEFFPAGTECDVAVFNDQGEYVNLLLLDDGWELYGLKKTDFTVVRVSS